MSSRLLEEFESMSKNPPAMTSAGPVNGNMHLWRGYLFGPRSTPYEKGVFRISISFPEEYPLRPPQIFFLTRIYHMNIQDEGLVCLDLLGPKWNPSISVAQILLALLTLLSNPNPNDPFDAAKAKLFTDKKSEYMKRAQEETLKYARPMQF